MRPGGRSLADRATLTDETTGYRPDPPDELSPQEQAVWRAVVLSVPAGWFTPECHLLLQRLCTVIVWMRALEDRWRANDFHLEGVDGPNYLEALNTAVHIATKLRLTLQSRKFKAGKAATKVANYAEAIEAPWSTDEEDKNQSARHQAQAA